MVMNRLHVLVLVGVLLVVGTSAAEHELFFNSVLTESLMPNDWDFIRLRIDQELHLNTATHRMLIVKCSTKKSTGITFGVLLKRVGQPTKTDYDWGVTFTKETANAGGGVIDTFIIVNATHISEGTYWIGVYGPSSQVNPANYSLQSFVYDEWTIAPNVTRKDTLQPSQWMYYAMYFANPEVYGIKGNHGWQLDATVTSQLDQNNGLVTVLIDKDSYPVPEKYGWKPSKPTASTEQNTNTYEQKIECTKAPSGMYYVAVQNTGTQVMDVDILISRTPKCMDYGAPAGTYLTLFIVMSCVVLVLGVILCWVSLRRKNMRREKLIKVVENPEELEKIQPDTIALALADDENRPMKSTGLLASQGHEGGAGLDEDY